MSAPASQRGTGIVIALAAEAATLGLRRARPGRLTPLPDGAAMWLSGMGPAAARHAAHALADAGAGGLAVFGVAGALSARLGNAVLFCPEQVLDEDGHGYAADPAWRAGLQQRLAAAGAPAHMQGALLSVAAPLLTPAAKADAWQRHAALAVDMESAAVAAVASERALPFIVLRAIVDEAGDAIPAALNDGVDAWGRARPLRLIAALCRHPALASELPRLYSRMQGATRALRMAAHAAGPTLGRPS